MNRRRAPARFERIAVCLALTALMLAPAAGPKAGYAGSRTASLCESGESSYFACAVEGGKLLSLCGSAAGNIEYRYGRHGAIELRQSAPLNTQDATFQLARYSRADVDRSTVRFKRSGVSYLIFDFTDGKRRAAGVDVTLLGKAQDRRIACRGPIHAQLARLQGRMVCDRESALQLGNCP